MTIEESIKKARERGLADSQILEEIIKQNPQKKEAFDNIAKTGKTSSQILEEISKRNAPAPLPVARPIIPTPAPKPSNLPISDRSSMESDISLSEEDKRKIEEARKRIEALKKSGQAAAAVFEPAPALEFKKETIAPLRVIKEAVSAGIEAKPEQKGKPEEIRQSILAKLRIKKETMASPPTLTAVPTGKVPINSSGIRSSRDILQSLPPKPAASEKLWIRLLLASLILVFLAASATFWYWYFVIRVQPPVAGCKVSTDCPENYSCSANGVCVERQAGKCLTDNDCTKDQVCSADKSCVQKTPQLVTPDSLFAVNQNRTISISNPEELQPLLLQIAQESEDAGFFKRIIIVNTKENKVISLKDFNNDLQLRVPADLYNKIKEDDCTIFSFSQTEGNRLGFVCRIEAQEGLADLLRGWEAAVASNMKDDFKPLLTLMAEDKPPVISYFRNASDQPGYAGPNFRFQTIARNDFGISYLVSDEYFAFTTSWRSMIQLINIMQISAKPIELAKDLKFGNSGYDVGVLQMWLGQDASVYPQNIISAKFGSLTQQAVIRFQEKYASDILAPQGLVRGNGIVDFYTRVKLNELYGKSGIIPLKPEITIDLRYGDHGDQVKVLQTWLKKDMVVYPQGIVSGWFGSLTRAAVIRFQEKYASEILEPQGLTRGSGIVDALTRRKLNGLYKDTQ